MPLLITKKHRPASWSLKDFYEKRNKILIMRTTGGLGDVLMHRMMFEDFKRTIPEGNIIFACPPKYFDAVKDHPFIDEIIDCRDVDPLDYIISYNTTSCCTRHEMAVAPFSDKNRSDIWANHCGVELVRHNMHINLTKEEKEWGKEAIKKVSGGRVPCVLICPISAMVVKNLLTHQLMGIVEGLKLLGAFPCGLHYTDLGELRKIGIPTLYGLKIREWMAVIHATDYIVTVDTASFHFAGGIGKPMTGIFTFADGKMYGKYYNYVLVQKHRDDGNWDCGPCYNWGCCPKTNKQPKPCLTELTTQMMLRGIVEMFERWPSEHIKQNRLQEIKEKVGDQREVKVVNLGINRVCHKF